MCRESTSHLDTVENTIGRCKFAEPCGVRFVSAVDPERRAISTEHSIEQERLNGCDTEIVVDVDECDAGYEFREIGGRSSGTSVHGVEDGETCKMGEPWVGGGSGSGTHAMARWNTQSLTTFELVAVNTENSRIDT